MKRSMILSAVTAACLLSAAGQAQVVISQVYGGGGNSGAPYRYDFIELHNRGTTAIDMSGWTVQRASAAGTFSAFTTAGNANTSPPFPSGSIILPGKYFLVRCSTNAAVGAELPGFDLDTVTITSGNPVINTGPTLSATNAKVALVNSNVAATGPTDPNVIDFLGYGSANAFEGAGACTVLSNTTAAFRANAGCDDTNNNAADFTPGAPAPRWSGTAANLCGTPVPDLALTLTDSGCNPAVGGAYQVVATSTNGGTAAAAGTTISVVLPPAVTYVSSTVSAGSATYNSGTRTVTANLGTLGAGAAGTLTVDTTASAVAGLTVTASTATTTSEPTVGNNAATKFNEVLSTAAPVGVIAIAANGGDTSIATAVDENGTERKLGTIYRTFTSADGNWIIFRTDLAGMAGNVNGAVIVGHNVGGVWSFSLVARDGLTAPVASMPNSLIDGNSAGTYDSTAGTFGGNDTIGNIQGINNSGEYVYSARLRDNAGTPTVFTDDTLTWVVVKGTVAGGVSSVIKQGDPATAPELAGRTYLTLNSATIQNNGTVSFGATLSGATTDNAVFVKNNGGTLLAQIGVTVPGNAAVAYKTLDDDVNADGRGVMVSADGNSWLGTGTINSGSTATDGVVVVNGTVAVREGSPVGSFTDPAGWNVFNTNVPQSLAPWAQMLPDGSWYIFGYNPATPGYNQGQDWAARNGNVLAYTGQPIVTGSTETWADNILQRTFFMETGSGNDYVVGGLTNRSTAANGSDTATDGVVVYRGTTVLAREGAPVEVAPSDVRYLNLINDNRSFIAGGKLYMTATLRNATSTCNQTFTGLPQAIVAVDLPTSNACPADIGQQGGLPGSDGQLNNNDFIVFIDYFFASDPRADVGQQGGLPGADGQFNNNDFIVFIDLFFAGC